MQWNVACDEMCHSVVPIGKSPNMQWRDDPFYPNHRNWSHIMHQISDVDLSDTDDPCFGTYSQVDTISANHYCQSLNSGDQDQDTLWINSLTSSFCCPSPHGPQRSRANWMSYFEARCPDVLHHSLDLPPHNFHISGTLQKALINGTPAWMTVVIFCNCCNTFTCQHPWRCFNCMCLI